VVPDTTFWIPPLRNLARAQHLPQELRGYTVYLSSVVAHELYAGTRSAQDKRDLDQLIRDMDRAQRTVSPSFADWCQAAVLLRRYDRQRGHLDPSARRRHAWDVLILLCAAQIGARVLTDNRDDFLRWNAMLPPRQQVGIDSAAGITP
jgi:predicted nucleic acid-binding protein